MSIIRAQQPLPRDQYLHSEIKERSFDKTQWEKSILGIDYSKSIDPVDEDDEAGDEEVMSSPQGQNKPGSSGNWTIGSGWDLFFKILFIGLLVTAIGFILYRVMLAGINQPKEKKLASQNMEINIEQIEENLHESDLNRFIREAINKENYTLAVRLYYLTIIKELSLRKMIRWKRDKTNKDYLQEITTPQLKSDFQGATRVFERIWYGKISIEENTFGQLQPAFQQLIADIEKTEIRTHEG